MKELMIHVERIVRPVRADLTKLRMRRELLAHLHAAYDEERAKGLDERAALAEAKRRLGDPAEITRQLQASVPRLDRLSCMLGTARFPRWLLVGGIISALLLPVIVATVPASWLISHDRGTFANILAVAPEHARLAMVLAVVVMELHAAAWYFLTINFMEMARLRRWMTVAGLGAFAISAQIIWTSLVYIALTGHVWAHESLAHFAFDQLAFAGVVLGMAFLFVIACLPRNEWLALDIAEEPC